MGACWSTQCPATNQLCYIGSSVFCPRGHCFTTLHRNAGRCFEPDAGNKVVCKRAVSRKTTCLSSAFLESIGQLGELAIFMLTLPLPYYLCRLGPAALASPTMDRPRVDSIWYFTGGKVQRHLSQRQMQLTREAKKPRGPFKPLPRLG